MIPSLAYHENGKSQLPVMPFWPLFLLRKPDREEFFTFVPILLLVVVTLLLEMCLRDTTLPLFLALSKFHHLTAMVEGFWLNKSHFAHWNHRHENSFVWDEIWGCLHPLHQIPPTVVSAWVQQKPTLDQGTAAPHAREKRVCVHQRHRPQGCSLQLQIIQAFLKQRHGASRHLAYWLGCQFTGPPSASWVMAQVPAIPRGDLD